MATESDGQVSASAAEIYEQFFVPALFSEWAPRVVESIAISAGARALDVACGTGLVTQELARVAGAEHVHGLDCNQGMLAVARNKQPEVNWHLGRAEELPFESESFDGVTCQFALMFFEDRLQALREMLRVLRPGGRLCVAVWGALADTPGYQAMTDLLEDLFGPEVARELEAPFCLGDREQLKALLEAASETRGAWQIQSLVGRGRFSSLEEWIRTDIRGWTLANRIDDRGLERLLEVAPSKLGRFVTRDGEVEFASPAHLATLQKPRT